ncbi:LysR family transcriptional regulator [Thalassotalea profundi]|nr:LysR substrate-binding domain-containing protein [Thalassotalea profundi]
MELKKLRYFVTVATLKNFTAAAKSLNTVQPAISRQIASLEAELGVKLLIRNTRAVTLTEAGSYLLENAQRMFELEQEIVTSVRKIDKGEIGQIRIGYLASACFSFIGELVGLFSQQLPNVRVQLTELTSQEQIDAFNKNEIDVGFSRPIPNDMNFQLDCKNIYNDRLVAVIPKCHALSKCESIAISDLKEENIILLNRMKAVGLFNKINTLFHQEEINPNIVSQPHNMQTLLTEVSAKLGIAIAPSCVAKLYTKGCSFIPLDCTGIEVPLEIQCLKDNNNIIVEEFVKLTTQNKKLIMQLSQLELSGHYPPK